MIADNSKILFWTDCQNCKKVSTRWCEKRKSNRPFVAMSEHPFSTIEELTIFWKCNNNYLHLYNHLLIEWTSLILTHQKGETISHTSLGILVLLVSQSKKLVWSTFRCMILRLSIWTELGKFLKKRVRKDHRLTAVELENNLLHIMLLLQVATSKELHIRRKKLIRLMSIRLRASSSHHLLTKNQKIFTTNMAFPIRPKIKAPLNSISQKISIFKVSTSPETNLAELPTAQQPTI